MNCCRVVTGALALIGMVVCGYAEETIDEDALFSDTSMMVDSSTVIDKSMSEGAVEKTSVSFSGSINSVADVGFSRDFFDDVNRKEITPSAYVLSELMLDVRLPKDNKAFGNLELTFDADSAVFNTYLQELFIDVNIKRQVYFRTGKQVLQWGRCYFWNPTDLINIEKKTIEPAIGTREGAYGVKMHVPFGTKYNLYGFVDMKKMTSVDSMAGSAKGEILLGSTEIGAAVWGKHNREPVFGIDFSTTVFDWDITGEMSLESGKNITIIKGLEKNEPMLDFLARVKSGDSTIDMNATVDKKVVPKICVGISRSFDVLDVKDRVMIISEFFVNKAGIRGDFYDEHDLKETFDSLGVNSSDSVMAAQLTKLQGRFSNPNEFSQYYLSFFATVNKFIVPEMVLQVNTIVNFEQHAALLIGALEYTTLHNLSIGLTLTSALGSDETEYTVSGSALTARLNLGVVF